MNFTSHSAVGLAVGTKIGSVPAAFLVGLAFHYIADMIPHVDFGSFDLKESKEIFGKKEVLTLALGDIATGFFVIIYSRPNWIVLAAILGSVLPDIIELPFWWNKIKDKKPFTWLHRIHGIFHFTIKDKKWIIFGLFSQIVVIIISLFLANFFDRLTQILVPLLAVIMSVWFFIIVNRKK